MENKAKGEIKKTIVYALYDFYKMKKNKIDSQFYYNYINRWADGLEETIRKIVKDGIQIKLKSELEPEPEPEPEPARAGKGISAVVLGSSEIQQLFNNRRI
jgi:hypothetical protein